MSNITREQLVKELDASFLNVALEDIKRSSDIKTNTNLAAFILGSCFIEALAGFYCGQDDPNTRSGSGDRFRKFVRKYLSQYNANDLWDSLRCGLVHSYAEKGKYNFVNKKRWLHFQSDKNGRIIINDEDFVEDLEMAYKDFKKDIINDPTIFSSAKKRFEGFGIMRITVV